MPASEPQSSTISPDAHQTTSPSISHTSRAVPRSAGPKSSVLSNSPPNPIAAERLKNKLSLAKAAQKLGLSKNAYAAKERLAKLSHDQISTLFPKPKTKHLLEKADLWQAIVNRIRSLKNANSPPSSSTPGWDSTPSASTANLSASPEKLSRPKSYSHQNDSNPPNPSTSTGIPPSPPKTSSPSPMSSASPSPLSPPISFSGIPTFSSKTIQPKSKVTYADILAWIQAGVVLKDHLHLPFLEPPRELLEHTPPSSHARQRLESIWKKKFGPTSYWPSQRPRIPLLRQLPRVQTKK